MTFAVAILFFVVAFLKPPALNVMEVRQAAGMEWLAIMSSLFVAKKFHWSVGLCFFWIVLECFQWDSLASLITILFFALLALQLTEKRADFMLHLLAFVALGDATILIFRYVTTLDVNNAWWTMGSASLESSFLAVTLPLVMSVGKLSKNTRLSMVLFILAAIVITRSNTGIFTALVMLMAYMTAIGKLTWRRLTAFTLLCVVAVLYLEYGCHKLLADQERYATWFKMMGFWRTQLNMWVGGGPGNYFTFAQVVYGKGHDKLVHMHNDLLEVLFTLGIPGLFSVLIMYVLMLKKALNRPFLFSMVIGYGCVSMTLFPNYLFFFEMLGIMLIYKCFVTKGDISCRIQ